MAISPLRYQVAHTCTLPACRGPSILKGVPPEYTYVEEKSLRQTARCALSVCRCYSWNTKRVHKIL